MATVFITGSSQGLGRGVAGALLNDGHRVVLHARNRERAASLGDIARRAAGVVVGDLSSDRETRSVAAQVNAIGRMDAVIHNAGVYLERERGATPGGHATVFAVNVLAPYLLTALVERPDRLVYLSSGLHRSGDPSARDLDWTERPWRSSQAYSDSKLYVAALALAVARHWPDVYSNVVDPGWVPTRMGGPGAPDDLELGHTTQAWLAVSDDPEARTSGGYWHHQRRRAPAAAVGDEAFQETLVAELARLTSINLPGW